MARAVFPILVLAAACQGRGTLTLAPIPSSDLAGTVVLRRFGNPIADAAVCVLGGEPCTTTETDGSFTLAVPLDAETAVTVEHPDVVPAVVPLVTSDRGDPPEVELALWSLGEWDQMTFVGNVDWSPGSGALQVEARQAADPPDAGQPDPGAEGVVVALDVTEARARYLDADGRYVDGSLGETSGSGTVLFFDLPDGTDRAVTLTPGSGDCSVREFGWPQGRVPVVADHLTIAVQACLPAR